MFWIFRDGEKGLDENGDTFKTALMKHILWCSKTVANKGSDSVDNFNALAELRDHFFRDKSFVKALGEDGEKWKSMVKRLLEIHYDEPIEEILKKPPTLMEGNHKWGWMPFTKQKD